MTHSALIIRVNVKEEPGFFYADSPDLPGLHVCGKTEEQTCTTVIKAIKALFKHNRKMDVEVVPATKNEESFPNLTWPCEQFVVQRLAA